MKSAVSELACIAGEPAFAEPLHVGRPHVPASSAVLERMAEILARRRLTNYGPFVDELESRLASRLGVQHCVTTGSGTAALQVAAVAAGMSGEVIVPAFTFVATAHALAWIGITPVLCDVDPATHNIDPAAAERLIGERTTGIVAVHLWGRPADIPALTALCERYDLKLVFDAAHAFDCSHGGRPVGGFGNVEILSLHATKVLNAGEGGALLTHDAELAARARLLSNFGFSGYDQVVSLGTNAKMSELSAAMGLASLDRVDEFIERNRANHVAYASGLAGIAGVSLVRPHSAERHNYHYVVVEVDAEEAGLGRDALQRVLWAENVLARRYFYPGVHRMEPYASRLGGTSAFPATDALASRTLLLPSGGELDPDAVARVCDLLRFACAHAHEIADRLGSDIG